jgi:hypothetical protein
VCWVLCLNRNDCVFNNKIVWSPHVILIKLISFLQHWMVMSLGGDMAMLESMVEDIRASAGRDGGDWCRLV